MPSVKRQRKFILFLCLGLAGVILTVLCFPVWFPWILRPIAAKYGTHYSRYIRNGYGSLTLQQITFTNRDLRLEVSNLNSTLPIRWLRHSVVEQNQESFVNITGWHLEILPGKSGSGRVPSITQIAQQTDAVFQRVRKWIPKATFSEGLIEFSEGKINLPSAHWTGNQLQLANAALLIPRLKGIGDLVSMGDLTNVALLAVPDSPQPWKIDLKLPTLELESTLRVSTNELGVLLQSTVFWLSNQITCDAQFGRSGIIPTQVSLQAPELSFSSPKLWGYSRITGGLGAKWENNQFSVDLKASGSPAEAPTNLPPFNLDLRISGDTNVASFHSVTASLPWFEAQLTKNFQYFFHGQHVRDKAEARLRINFDKQDWLPLEGILTGNAQLTPGREKFPQVHFELSGSDFGRKELKASAVEIEGNCAWPLLEIVQAKARFDAGSSGTLKGKFEYEKKEVLAAQLELEGGFFRRWLPAGSSYSRLRMMASVDGPLASLNHRGRLDVTNFTSPQTKPVDLRAEWKGKQLNLESASLFLSAQTSSIAIEGSMAEAGKNLTVNTITLSKAGKPLLALKKPVTVLSQFQTNRWLAHISSLDWQGVGGSFRIEGGVNWPVSGALNISAENLQSSIAEDFLKAKWESFEIKSLKSVAGWTNGPLVLSLDASATMIPQKDFPLTALLSLSGDARGILISNLLVTSQTSSLVAAHGLLPISVYPGLSTNFVRWNPEQAIQIMARTDPQSRVWDKVAEWSGMGLVAPNLQVNIFGTSEAPQGNIQLQASQLKFPRSLTNVPPLDDIFVSIELNRNIARVTECQCLVQGQPMRLTGEFPLGEAFWNRNLTLPDWKIGHAHFMVQNAQLAAMAPFFPQFVSPQGELSLDLEMQPGPKFNGTLRVLQARTHSIEALGPIRDIALQLKLHENKVTLDSATGNIGGATVTANGEADLEGMNWHEITLPPLRFSLRGTNVPVSRRPESVIRSDLDLVILKTNSGPGLISGKARLRNSYFLHDLADLIPAKVASPTRRPPYFSVDSKPIADWRLAVQVTGEKFLKIRSTIFNGEVSANLNLQGSLKEPMVLGDVRVDSGLVRFPFADLKVQQGFVTLTSRDPYRPQLAVSAASRQYGYDLRMDVSGPADAPILQFTSTPPLSSEQIILMVTAGEMPRDERSLSTQKRAQTLAVYVGKDLLTRLGFGDDKEQRLSIQSGEQLSEQGRPTYTVEYELTDRWSLVGEYDRFNAYNAGLKWKVYSK